MYWRHATFAEVLACCRYLHVVVENRSQVGPGMAVLEALGHQYGSGAAVSRALGRHVGNGMAVSRALGRILASRVASDLHFDTFGGMLGWVLEGFRAVFWHAFGCETHFATHNAFIAAETTLLHLLALLLLPL